MSRVWRIAVPGRAGESVWALLRRSGKRISALPLALFSLHLVARPALADVGVVLNESLDEDFDRISSTGHNAIKAEQCGWTLQSRASRHKLEIGMARNGGRYDDS
jgi:hypothetical protein